MSGLFGRSDEADAAVLDPIRRIAAAIDTLRREQGFLEARGSEVRHGPPGASFSHFVPAGPGAAWALNLALLTRDGPFACDHPPPGTISRALFRADVEPDEIASALIAGISAALEQAYGVFHQLAPDFARGQAALAHLSRHARARDAWRLVAALRSVTRTQLGRAFVLSRAGADIQARTLADAGLVTLAAGGSIAWTPARAANAVPDRLDQGPLGDAVSDLDASMAEIDRLLAQTAQRPDRSD